MTFRVADVWRYPVKSLQGERLEALALTSQGLEGDRAYAIFDLETGLGLTARRHPELLFASARLLADGSVEITLPDGTIAADDHALSVWLGRDVVLRSTQEQTSRRYESPADFEHETRWEPFDGSRGAFHDSPRASVSLVSTATIGSWPWRRFRANVLLDGAGEDALVGSRVGVGNALLDVSTCIERCVMVTRPQPGGIHRDLDVLRTIHRERKSRLAVGALVVRTGKVAVGEALDTLA